MEDKERERHIPSPTTTSLRFKSGRLERDDAGGWSMVVVESELEA